MSYKSNHEAERPEDPGERALLEVLVFATRGVAVHARNDWDEGENKSNKHHHCTDQLD